MKKVVLLVLLLVAAFAVHAQSPVEITQTGISGSSGVYPNPSSGTAYLDVESEYDIKGAKLSVTNLLGEAIYEKQVGLSKGKNILSFEREQLAPGIYLVKLSSGSEQVTRRFTVNR